MAKAEMWAASAASASDNGALLLEKRCAELGVAYWPLLSPDPKWVHGVWCLLRWLLGESDAHGRTDPPMQLPVRGECGAVLTAHELYDAAIAADPYARWGPEERRALRLQTEAEAFRSRRLGALIEETKLSLGVLP